MLSVLVLLAAAEASRYPAALRVEPSAAARSALYVHEPDSMGLSSPPCDASFSFVGKDAVAAYQTLARRHFQEGAETKLELRLVSVAPSVDWQKDGWHAVVRHEVQLFDMRGEQVAKWTVEGRGRVIGLGEGALPAAFADAAEVAAQQFAAHFEEPAGVVALLERLGVPRATVFRAPAIAEKPLPPPPSPPEIHPRPTEPSLYVDAGTRVAFLGYQTTTPTSPSGTDGEVLAWGFDVRAGVAGWYMFAQVSASRGSADHGDVGHALTSIGLDFGARARLNRIMDIAAGIGIGSSRIGFSSYAFGPRPVTKEQWQDEQDLLLALRMAPPFAQRLRLRVTIETRYRLASFQTAMINDTYRDDVATGFSFSFLLGVELPLRRGDSR